jgi:hypothetical protein
MVGYNCHQLADFLHEDYVSTWIYLANDGSSHDAHQDIKLIQCVDHYFLTRILDNVLRSCSAP